MDKKHHELLGIACVHVMLDGVQSNDVVESRLTCLPQARRGYSILALIGPALAARLRGLILLGCCWRPGENGRVEVQVKMQVRHY